MQTFYGPDGETIGFSNGSMATLYWTWSAVAAGRRPPRTEDEAAVADVLREDSQQFPHQYASAFRLFPPDDEIASPERLTYLAELVRLSAADLVGDAEPDEELWDYAVAWSSERRAIWHDRLSALASLIDRARDALAAGAIPRIPS